MTGNSEINRRIFGIPFTREMAVAASRPTNPKRQTRRVIQPQWYLQGKRLRYDGTDDHNPKHIIHFMEELDENGWPLEKYRNIGECPYGQVGDYLFIQEEWWHYKSEYLEMAGFPEGTITHLEDGRSGHFHRTYEGFSYADHPDIWTKREAKDMPRWASRITLEITDVRVERLQEISEEDALAEGAEPILVPSDGGGAPHVEGFHLLWDNLAKPGAKWTDNPWVWVIGFRRVEG